MESPPSSVHGQEGRRSPAKRPSAIEALLSPKKDSPGTPPVSTPGMFDDVAEAVQERDSEESYTEQEGRQGERKDEGSNTTGGSDAAIIPAVVLEGVLPEMLEALASTEPESLGGLDEVALVGGEEARDSADGARGETAVTVVQADALMLLSVLCDWSLVDERSPTEGSGGAATVESRLLESKVTAQMDDLSFSFLFFFLFVSLCFPVNCTFAKVRVVLPNVLMLGREGVFGWRW